MCDVRSKLVHAENFLVALDNVVHQNLLCEKLEWLLRMSVASRCSMDASSKVDGCSIMDLSFV